MFKLSNRGLFLWAKFRKTIRLILFSFVIEKLCTRKDSRGSGEVTGYKGFLGQAKDALDKISTAEGELGTDVISSLQSSSYNFDITESTSNSFNPAGKDRVYSRVNDAHYTQGIKTGKGQIYGSPKSNIIGSGGVIFWNPNSKIDIATNIGIKTADPTQVLGHEMFHGYDANFGNLVSDYYPNSAIGTQVKEIRADCFFNQLGSAKTFNTGYYQTHYSTDKSGYNYLDSNGQPRTVSPTILWDK